MGLFGNRCVSSGPISGMGMADLYEEVVMPLAVEKFVGEDLRTDSTLSFQF